MSSARIRYAYLKGQTWLYRRNYPKDAVALIGQKALKQSLKTSDAKIARQRAAEVNLRYDETVRKALSGAVSLLQSTEQTADGAVGWATPSEVALARLRSALRHSDPICYDTVELPKLTVADALRRYLILREKELRLLIVTEN